MIVLNHPRAGRARNSSMACKLKALSERTRCRFWSMPSIPIMSSNWKVDEKLQGRGVVQWEWRLMPELAELAPKGDRRMGANPHTNGGILLRDLRMPDFHVHAVMCLLPGPLRPGYARAGQLPAGCGQLNEDQHNFRVFGPDETLSNLLGSGFSSHQSPVGCPGSKKTMNSRPAGRVLDSMLSENQCEGWLEGYLLTGGTGCSIVMSFHSHHRSMFSQTQMLKVSGTAMARKISSLNYLLASHVLAAGSQWLHAPGSWLPRSRHQQESRYRAQE